VCGKALTDVALELKIVTHESALPVTINQDMILTTR